ncbi:hypothetical protein HY497_00890 [Candidatus Woesearchaeota archaeon]|nr:hypothetical protein [Candidatus Woesearchaeota archaeon]
MVQRKLVAAAGLIALLLGVKDTPLPAEQLQKSYQEVRTHPELWTEYIQRQARKMGLPDYVGVTVIDKAEHKGRPVPNDALMSTVPEKPGLGTGAKSIIEVFEHTFTFWEMQADDDVRSYLAHEAEHARQFHHGIVYHSGRCVTLEDFITGEKNGEKLYSQVALDAVLELGAYDLHVKQKMSPDVGGIILKNYAVQFGTFVFYGRNLDPDVYRETINEYFREWMLERNIVGVMKDERGRERYFMRAKNADFMLPADTPKPRE